MPQRRPLTCRPRLILLCTMARQASTTFQFRLPRAAPKWFYLRFVWKVAVDRSPPTPAFVVQGVWQGSDPWAKRMVRIIRTSTLGGAISKAEIQESTKPIREKENVYSKMPNCCLDKEKKKVPPCTSTNSHQTFAWISTLTGTRHSLPRSTGGPVLDFPTKWHQNRPPHAPAHQVGARDFGTLQKLCPVAAKDFPGLPLQNPESKSKRRILFW